MTTDPLENRFMELNAGLALGDLDAAETQELQELCEKLGRQPDQSLAMTAAALDAAFSVDQNQSLPSNLAAQIERLAEHDPVTSISAQNLPQAVESTNILRPWFKSPSIGWAAAAVLLAMLLIDKLNPTKIGSSGPSASELISKAKDKLQIPFSGVGNYQSIAGDVVWSDDLQQGFMKLTGIPVNNPEQAQYQLWIVDPERDADAPVDGGVFDVAANSGEVIIPIDAKLPIAKPKAFVITLEQPGGVVKSRQEVVVALAKL